MSDNLHTESLMIHILLICVFVAGGIAMVAASNYARKHKRVKKILEAIVGFAMVLGAASMFVLLWEFSS